MFQPQKDIPGNFPVCPSILRPSGFVLTDGQGLLVWKDETVIGHWSPLSSYAIEITTDAGTMILTNFNDHQWKDYSTNTKYEWSSVAKTRKRPRSTDHGMLSTPGSASKRPGSRGCILPLHPLDIKHRHLIEALGLRVCMHSEIGRVLVTARQFETGDYVTFSNLVPLPISTEDALSKLIKPSDPPGTYLCVPRTGVVYYNTEFDPEDPIGSGDIWYLVNHSDTPNCELKAHAHGLIIRAKRKIRENEPLTWAYNSGFFGTEDAKLDFPGFVFPDESTVYQAN